MTSTHYMDPADRALDLLAIAPVVINPRRRLSCDIKPYQDLVLRGLAEVAPPLARDPDYVTTYRLTPDGWRTVQARHARIVPVAEMIRRKGLNEKTAVRNLMARLKRAARAPAPRWFPGKPDRNHSFTWREPAGTLRKSDYTEQVAKQDRDLDLAGYIRRFEELNGLKVTA